MLNEYTLGSTVRLSFSFSVDGVGTNPGTVTLEVRSPDGTITNPAVVSDGGGHYHADFTPTVSGVHFYYSTGSNFVGLPAASTVANEVAFYVADSKVLHP